jgi:hypothetical protein
MKVLLTYAVLILILIGCHKAMDYEFEQMKRKDGHTCPFDLCPYKGLHTFSGVIHTGESVVDTSVEEGTDLWCIDALHFEYPNDSYDQLEDKLFNPSSWKETK